METTKEDRVKHRFEFHEHGMQIEEILFSTILKLGEDKGVVANATALATLTHAWIDIRRFYRGENMFSTSMNIDMDGTSDLSE